MSEFITYSAAVLTHPPIPISSHFVRLANIASTRNSVRIIVISYVIVDTASYQLQDSTKSANLYPDFSIRKLMIRDLTGNPHS